MSESPLGTFVRRQEYIGRAPEAPNSGPARTDVSAWVVPVLVVAFIVGTISLGVAGGVLAMGLTVLPVVAVALTEFDRRRLRNASFGYLDATLAPGAMRFSSARRVVWLGVVVILLGTATLVIFLLALSDLGNGGGRRGSGALFLLAGVICVALGGRIVWFALTSATIVIDAQGVETGGLVSGRTRLVPWDHGIFAHAEGGALVVSGTGRVTANVRYLKTDPVIVADIINRCSADAELRARLGGEMVDLLKAEEPWRRNRPAGSAAGEP